MREHDLRIDRQYGWTLLLGDRNHELGMHPAGVEGYIVEHLRVPNNGVTFLNGNVFGQEVECLGCGRNAACAGLHVPDGGAVGPGLGSHILPGLNDPIDLSQ